MPLLSEEFIRQLGRQDIIKKGFNKAASEILSEQKQIERFDIFLSHAFKDQDLIIGLRKFLSSQGLAVYVDWIDDKQLDREQVNQTTAETLKKRMEQSSCLFFATTENSKDSKWMPWELGYFDGTNGKVAIFPLAKTDQQYDFKGTEYLGLYPFVKDLGGSVGLFIYNQNGESATLRQWLKGAPLKK